MDDLKVGALLRAARRRLRLRQRDVAARAGVSQQTVSNVESGRLDRMELSVVRAVAAAVGVRLPLDPRMTVAYPAQLLDARHADLVDRVVSELVRRNWEVLTEYSFNHFGERGCVDIVAWHAATQSLLLIEVKSMLADSQELLRVVGARERVVPPQLTKERGWKPRSVASFVVMPEESATRRAVARLGATFDASLPLRNVAIRHWLDAPSGNARGIWFLPDTTRAGARRNPGSPGRIRKPGNR